MPRPRHHLALTLVLALTATGAATAQTTPDPAMSGLLSASGSGAVVMDGQATVIGLVRAPILIVVQDRVPASAGAVDLRVGGRAVRPQSLTTSPPFVTVRRYRLGRGTRRFILTGDNMRMRIVADTMSLSISGRLRVWLRGSGEYRLDGAGPQAWTGALLRVGGATAGKQVSPTP